MFGRWNGDQVKRMIAADQDEIAKHGRCRIVGMCRTAGYTLTLDGEVNKFHFRAWRSEQFVCRDQCCRRTGGTASHAARKREVLFQRETDMAVERDCLVGAYVLQKLQDNET